MRFLKRTRLQNNLSERLETWRKKAMPVYEKRAAEVGGMELIEKIQKAGQ